MEDQNHSGAPQPPPVYPPPPPGSQPPPGQGEGQALSSDERQWAMFCHLAAFAGCIAGPLGSIVGPLVVWLIKKEEYPFVDDQGKQALNFQISVTIYAILCIPLVFVLIGIPLLIAIGILDVICTITGAIKANQGIAYRYPLAIQFIK